MMGSSIRDLFQPRSPVLSWDTLEALDAAVVRFSSQLVPTPTSRVHPAHAERERSAGFYDPFSPLELHRRCDRPLDSFLTPLEIAASGNQTCSSLKSNPHPDGSGSDVVEALLEQLLELTGNKKKRQRHPEPFCIKEQHDISRNLSANVSEKRVQKEIRPFGILKKNVNKCHQASPGNAFSKAGTGENAKVSFSLTSTQPLQLKSSQPSPPPRTTSSSVVEKKPSMSGRVVSVAITNVLYPVDVDILKFIFSKYGAVDKIANFSKCSNGFNALVQMKSPEEAGQAILKLNNRNIYDGCNSLQVQPSILTDLNLIPTGSKPLTKTSKLENESNSGLPPLPMFSSFFSASESFSHNYLDEIKSDDEFEDIFSNVSSRSVLKTKSSTQLDSHIKNINEIFDISNNQTSSNRSFLDSLLDWSPNSKGSDLSRVQMSDLFFMNTASTIQHTTPLNKSQNKSPLQSPNPPINSADWSNLFCSKNFDSQNGSPKNFLENFLSLSFLDSDFELHDDSHCPKEKNPVSPINNNNNCRTDNNSGNNNFGSGTYIKPAVPPPKHPPISLSFPNSPLSLSFLSRLPKEVRDLKMNHINPNATTVLIVYNLTPNVVSVAELFNVFSLCGFVERIKILRNRPHTALVQYSNSVYAALAAHFLQGIALRQSDPAVQISFSRNTEIKLPPSEGLDGSTEKPSPEDCKRSKAFSALEQRFRLQEGEKYLRAACKPTSILFVAGLAEPTTENDVRELLSAYGTIHHITIQQSGRKKSATVCVNDATEALWILARLHNYVLHGSSIKIAFTRMNPAVSKSWDIIIS